MKLNIGTTRIAFVGEDLTVKIPDPKTLFLRLSFIQDYLEIYLDTREKAYLVYGIMAAFEGVLNNLRERRHSKEFDGLVMQTYISIFGLINIQASSKDSNLKMGEIFYKLIELIGPEEAYHDGHTFHNPDNFGIDRDGKLKLRDYGSEETIYLLRKFRKEIEGLFANKS